MKFDSMIYLKVFRETIPKRDDELNLITRALLLEVCGLFILRS